MNDYVNVELDVWVNKFMAIEDMRLVDAELIELEKKIICVKWKKQMSIEEPERTVIKHLMDKCEFIPVPSQGYNYSSAKY